MAKAKSKAKSSAKKTQKQIEKELEAKLEKEIEKKVGNWGKGPGAKVAGEIIAYIISLVTLFYLIPLLPFITEDYSFWLPIAFWATTLSQLAKILKHLSSNQPAKKLFEVLNLLPAIYSTYIFMQIYPLSFATDIVDTIVKIVLPLLILAMLIGVIVNFIQIFVPGKKSK